MIAYTTEPSELLGTVIFTSIGWPLDCRLSIAIFLCNSFSLRGALTVAAPRYAIRLNMAQLSSSGGLSR